MPHNQPCFHATDRVTQHQHPPVRLRLISCVSLVCCALAGMRGLRGEEAINDPKVISFEAVTSTHWENNRESGWLVACGSL